MMLTALATISAVGARQPNAGTVTVQLLALNDFHGHLDPPSGSNGRIGNADAGGAEYLATHLRVLRARNPNTIVVAAGDLIGASPLLSAMFHDEPSIEAMNAMGLAVSSVGNHEFDEGPQELLRMQHGGCHPIDGCRGPAPFSGATFQYLSANVRVDSKTTGRREPLLPPYVVKDIGGVRIGFIGLTLKGTPALVTPDAVRGLTFDSEAPTANHWAAVLKSQRVRAIVVLIHEGGVPALDQYDGCPGISGPVVGIARRMSDEIDVVVSGHTHRAYNCLIDGKLVTSAAAFGRVVTAIDLTLDPRTADVVSKRAHNVIVSRDVEKDPEQGAILERYRPLYTVVGERVVGEIAGDLTRLASAAGESSLGDVIADATLEAARASSRADVAFMNPGGIRADLPFRSENGHPTRAITHAETSTVLPFGNRITVMTLTGKQIKEVLEQQFDNAGPGLDKILQVSHGFRYAYDRAARRSRRVDPRSMTIDNRQVVPNQRYHIAANEFLAAGGDNFPAFTKGTGVVTVGVDLDALLAYFGKHSPVAPPQLGRIVRKK
jgi:5'-nucleotidase